MNITTRLGLRAALLAGAAFAPIAVSAQTVPTEQPAETVQGATPDAAAGESNDDLQEVVVTGTTSRDRPLITASADITLANRDAIDRKAARSTADLLELVPGIFVEATAGAVSNNYSVRGLQGGGQRFVQLEEDGMPILYGGGGADFFFDQDLTINRLEAVKGGSSGVLTVNGAGATINFISKTPNHDRAEGQARFTAYNYGMRRGDFYVSTPLTDHLAVNLGGYYQSSPGVRDNPFNYDGFRLKGMLEYRMDNGGFIRLSGRGGDLENAYYADQPYAFRNGDPKSVPSLDTQFGNVGGNAFKNIAVPVSTFANPTGFRNFRYDKGIVSKNWQVRLDMDAPVTDSIDLFVKSRYQDYSYDFNGLFPGSATGNAGLTSAVNYLTPGDQSPIGGLLALGQAAFPAAVRFGIKDLRTGQVIGSNQTAVLNALNGNGFLQRTTLNHDYVKGRDFGMNSGARWEYQGGSFKNSLTAGVMYYDVRRFQDQSATASVINDVKTNSNVYDIVALDAGNNVVGTLSDNGLVSYGDWGAGLRKREDSTVSLYANDEFEIGGLHIDAGLRWERDAAGSFDGQTPTAADPGNRIVEVSPGNFQQLVPAGTPGLIPTVGSTFSGIYLASNPNVTGIDGRIVQSKVAWTAGANYLITPNLSIYGRYADGFQTNNTDPFTTIELYEAGVRYQYRRFFSGSATVFQTNFRNQSYNFANPVNPTQQQNINADLRTRGIELDFVVRPISAFSIDFQGVLQEPKLLNLQIDGAAQTGYEGNRPERTPAKLFTVTPTFQLPGGLGEVYGRYKFVGRIFADAGNGVALPEYGVTSAGITINPTQNIQVNFNADNIFDVVGLTEGNPRQGQTQAITDGFFYARGIVGTTYGGSVTVRF